MTRNSIDFRLIALAEFGDPKEADDALHEGGLLLVGRDETGTRMEVAELPGHPYYVGCQFHPEFLSRPLKPSPPFHGLILASIGKLDGHLETQRQQVQG